MNESSDYSDMPSEVDFSKGKRGKHFKDACEAHTVRITTDDGTVEVHHYEALPGSVLLDSDLQRKFPDADSVNNALRFYLGTVERH